MIASQIEKTLESTASRISSRATEELARKEKAMKDAVRKLEEERRVEKEEAEEARRQREAGIARRLPFARKGLERLILMSKHPTIQSIMASRGLLRQGVDITFFEAERSSGDDWDKDPKKYEDEHRKWYGTTKNVDVYFTKEGLSFYCGKVSAPPMRSWHIAPREEDVVEYKYDKEETSTTIDAFLREIAGPATVNMNTVMHSNQRSLEWEPEEVLFQLLVSCARKATFDKYLLECLKRL